MEVWSTSKANQNQTHKEGCNTSFNYAGTDTEKPGLPIALVVFSYCHPNSLYSAPALLQLPSPASSSTPSCCLLPPPSPAFPCSSLSQLDFQLPHPKTTAESTILNDSPTPSLHPIIPLASRASVCLSTSWQLDLPSLVGHCLAWPQESRKLLGECWQHGQDMGVGIYRCIFFSDVVCAALMPRSMLGFCTNMQETTLAMKNLQPKHKQGRTCRGLKRNKVQGQGGGRQEQIEVVCVCFAGWKAMEKQSSV